MQDDLAQIKTERDNLKIDLTESKEDKLELEEIAEKQAKDIEAKDLELIFLRDSLRDLRDCILAQSSGKS